jgi:hypothetical protein
MNKMKKKIGPKKVNEKKKQGRSWGLQCCIYGGKERKRKREDVKRIKY